MGNTLNSQGMYDVNGACMVACMVIQVGKGNTLNSQGMYDVDGACMVACMVYKWAWDVAEQPGYV